MTAQWRLEGYDAFDGEAYELGDFGDYGEDGRSQLDGMKPVYDTYEEALADARVRLASLEASQPASSSGGQAYGGIQDRVYVVHPDGRHERVFS